MYIIAPFGRSILFYCFMRRSAASKSSMCVCVYVYVYMCVCVCVCVCLCAARRRRRKGPCPERMHVAVPRTNACRRRTS